MAKTVTLRDVRQRRKEIAAEIARLQAEDAELEIATRALERLLGQAETPIGAAFAMAAPVAVSERPTPQKPGGLPTVPQMIIFALKDAIANGKSGLEPKEITDFIKKNYWPEADINKVGPIAWRMWKRHELAKSGAKYSLKTEASNEETNGDAPT